MSIGFTFTTRPHANAAVGPRSGPQIIEEGLERAQDEAARVAVRAAYGRRAALEAAMRSLPPAAVIGLLIEHHGLDMALSCDDATTWRAHHDLVDGVVVGEDSSPLAALDLCARLAGEGG